MRLSLLLLCPLVFSFAFAGCRKSEQASAISSAKSTPTPAQEKAAIDACTLLIREEIEQSQGVAPAQTKASSNLQGGLAVSQCYFLLPTAADSIVLTVTQPNPGARDPRELWEETFHREQEKSHARGEEEEKEKKAPPPVKIDGLGDEAFWAPQRFGGMLYALKGHSFITLTIGGGSDEATKMKQSKNLAEMALKRL